MATTIKYIDFQLQHQIITFNIKRNLIGYIDDNDITSYWSGFLAPPPHSTGTDMQKFNNKDSKSSNKKNKGKYFKNKNKLQIPSLSQSLDSSSQTPQKHAIVTDPGMFKSPKSSMIDQQGSELVEGTKYKCCCNEEGKRDKNLAINNEQFQLCKDCENLLHLAEYARKFVLEYENNEVIDDTWPFLFNSLYDKEKYRERYQQKCEQYGLLNFNPLDIIRPLLEKTQGKYHQTHWRQGRVEKAYLKYKAIANKKKNDDIDHIRHRRKLAAKYLLGRYTVLSNIEYIKTRLTQIFQRITLESLEKELNPATPNTDSSPILKAQTIMSTIGAMPRLTSVFSVPTPQESIAINELHPTNTQDIAYKLMPENTKVRQIWKQWINILIQVVDDEPSIDDEGERIDQAFNKKYANAEDIINEIQRVHNEKKLPPFYTEFINTFIALPHWYITDKHDRLLLMFAVKYGTHVEKYTEELNGYPSCNKYEKYLGTTYKLFEQFCLGPNNVLNRLRYLTYILRYMIISPYQKDKQQKDFQLPKLSAIHDEKEKPTAENVKFTELMRDSNDNIKPGKRIRFNLIFMNDDQAAIHEGSYIGKDENDFDAKKQSLKDVTSWRQFGTISFSRIPRNDSGRESTMSLHDAHNYRTIVRDIYREFQDVLQLYDLVHYGPMLCKHLMRQLKFKQRRGLYIAIGILCREIPTIIAIELLQQYQQELRHGEPSMIYWICLNILEISNNKQCTALILSHYLKMHKDIDLARSEEWLKYSVEMQNIASDSLRSIESSFVLALTLMIPCQIHKHQLNTLMTALEYRCVEFVNNERLNEIVDFMWHDLEFLNPRHSSSYVVDAGDKLKLLFKSPALFYFTPMGLNWTTTILFLLYLVCVCYFVIEQVYPYQEFGVIEGILWLFNLGFIVYELQEMIDSGVATYFSFATNGYLNLFDFLISLNWIIIFIVRFIPTQSTSHDDPVTVIYMLLWAIQCVLLSIRLLTLFKTSKHLGVFLRMLQLMFVDVCKFAVVLMIIFFGFLFGTWFIVADDYEDADVSQQLDDVKGTALYLFQTLVGQQDWEVVQANGDHNVGTARSNILQGIIIIFTIIGAVLLLNLLIALMTTTYDNVEGISKHERAYVKAQEASDLLHRGRFIAPPFNLIVFILAGFFITAFVLIPGLITSSWNPYRFISFANPFRYECFAKNSMIGDSIRRRTTEKRRKSRKKRHILYEPDYLKQSKRNWWLFSHRFCRYCYCCITDQDDTSIDHYMRKLKKRYKVEIEPTDKATLMKNCIGLYFCPCCFRNFRIEDLYTAFQVSLDFWSFYVFLLIVLLPTGILLAIPALIESKFVNRDDHRELTEQELYELHQQYDREYSIQEESTLIHQLHHHRNQSMT